MNGDQFLSAEEVERIDREKAENDKKLVEFLAAVKADDAAAFAGMPEPSEMWAVVRADAREEASPPLAFFQIERAAWHWLFMKYGENDNFAVRAFMVSAAVVE